MAKQYYKTVIERPGLKLEGRELHVGTVLVTAAEPPKHYQSFATISKFYPGDKPKQELKTGLKGPGRPKKSETDQDSE